MTLRKMIVVAVIVLTAGGTYDADACTRVVYSGNDSLFVVGRSLDWKTPIPTNLWVFPRGVAKKSHEKAGAIEWVSRYGAVYAVSYDGGVTEGMNECGLAVNGLFCKGTVYVDPAAGTDCGKPMSLAVFVEWMLDLNSTTAEVVEALRTTDFKISGSTFDGGTVSTLHWGITDATGHTAVLEFDRGEMKIYDNVEPAVLTNDPQWPAMTAINDYWRAVGGVNMLPGTVRSADRFARASFFVGHVEKTSDADLGVAIARTIIQNASVPYTYAIEGEPNVSSTQWRSFSDLRGRRYYFDIVTYPAMFHVDLTKLDMAAGAPVLRLDVESVKGVSGDVGALMVPTPAFKPMY